jgi:SnoaL-like polyketide cyclase
MPDDSVMRDLFDRWELVWHEDRHDLIPGCVASAYLRHEATGDRVVTAESYGAELKKLKADRPDVRVAVYDHLFQGNRAWFRFMFKWRDPKNGETVTQAGMQSYRTEDGRLAETWIVLQPIGSKWPDLFAQERWTSPPPQPQ